MISAIVRTVHLIREYERGWYATGDARYLWGIADCQREMELLLAEAMR